MLCCGRRRGKSATRPSPSSRPTPVHPNPNRETQGNSQIKLTNDANPLARLSCDILTGHTVASEGELL
jgi:hypothetical protein